MTALSRFFISAGVISTSSLRFLMSTTIVSPFLSAAIGPGSRAPVGMRYYQLWTFRGPTVIRIESVKERADALGAVGLSEQDISA